MVLADDVVRTRRRRSLRVPRSWLMIVGRTRRGKTVSMPALTRRASSGRIAVIAVLDVLLHAGCAAAVMAMTDLFGFMNAMTIAGAAVCYGLLWLTLAIPTDSQRAAARRGSLWQSWVRRCAVAAGAFVAAAVVVAFGQAPTGVIRSALVTAVLSCVVGAPVGALAARLLGSSGSPLRALLVGAPPALARTADRLDRPGRRTDVVGTFDSTAEDPGGAAERASRIAERATALGADVVILCGTPEAASVPPAHLGWELERTTARLLIDTELACLPSRRLRGERVGGVQAVAVEPWRPPVSSRLSGIAQWVVALIGLLISAPLLLVIAVIVRIESTGPAFFVQERVGLNGKCFRMYKLRTMTQSLGIKICDIPPEADAPDRGPLFKARCDPRVTRAGRVLRRTSLDELPQLLNVVLGHMRLVGPRPALPSEVARYRGYESRRLLVKPGLTGLWQVGGRSDLDWRRSVELDHEYVEDGSLGLDLKVAVLTPHAVVRAKGAY